MFGINWRKVIVWAVVIGIVLWIFKDPQHAASTASSGVKSAGNLAVKGITAVISFVQGVFQ